MNTMNKKELSRLILTAAGKEEADLVIRNARVADVYSGTLIEGDIAVVGGRIAGVGSYRGRGEYDAEGRIASPGLIDSHVHIESSYVTPEEFGRMAVPHGTTTVIADPHEIVNVCGLTGLHYMQEAAEHTVLDIRFAMPSCVPATPFEHSGAVVTADDMSLEIRKERIASLGEFMNFVGVVQAENSCLDKILCAQAAGKVIDGHSPGLAGSLLNAYAAAGICNDHECSTLEEMRDRISRGMYILMREGSACHDLERLLPGFTPENAGRLLLCSDDRQADTTWRLGYLEHHLRICTAAGVPPVTAIRMASLNAAECFRLYDRGAIAPGRRADIVLFDDLEQFQVSRVYIEGRLAAEDGRYLPEFTRADISPVRAGFQVKDLRPDRLNVWCGDGEVLTVGVLPGGVVTRKAVCRVKTDEEGRFVFDPSVDVVKAAVIERHHATGHMAAALMSGYGLKRGAIAVSIAHDSHNIIAAGADDGDILLAVRELIAQGGGMILTLDGKVIDSLPMPVGGIMSDRDPAWVSEKLAAFHENAWGKLGISRQIEPVMTLTFMALPVIPEIKLTDMGLFDVTTFSFVTVKGEPVSHE